MKELTDLEHWAITNIKKGKLIKYILQECLTVCYYCDSIRKKYKILRIFTSPAGDLFCVLREKENPVKNFIQLDGKQIKISDETAAEFRKKFRGKTRWEAVREYLIPRINSEKEIRFNDLYHAVEFHVGPSFPAIFDLWREIENLHSRFDQISLNIVNNNLYKIQILNPDEIYNE